MTGCYDCPRRGITSSKTGVGTAKAPGWRSRRSRPGGYGEVVFSPPGERSVCLLPRKLFEFYLEMACSGAFKGIVFMVRVYLRGGWMGREESSSRTAIKMELVSECIGYPPQTYSIPRTVPPDTLPPHVRYSPVVEAKLKTGALNRPPDSNRSTSIDFVHVNGRSQPIYRYHISKIYSGIVFVLLCFCVLFCALLVILSLLLVIISGQHDGLFLSGSPPVFTFVYTFVFSSQINSAAAATAIVIF